MSYAFQIPKTGNPEVLTEAPLQIPVPKAGEVVIQNVAAAVNFIDTIIRRGEMPAGMMPELPHIPGVEGAGVVQAIGDGVDALNVGDRVAWMGFIGAGGYASHSLVKADYVLPIPDSMSFNTAAALPVNGMTAWHMLVNLGQAKAGQTVLVHAAAGGVGTLAIQIAKSLGLTVIGSVSSDKLEYTLQQGADYVVDYRTEDVTARVAEITNGRGVDLTLNPISGDSLKADMKMLAPLGTVILFGFLAGPPTGNFADDMAQHFNKSIAVRVSDIYTYYLNQPQQFRDDFAVLIKQAESGQLLPVIDQAISIRDVASARSRLESGLVQGKLVLEID